MKCFVSSLTLFVLFIENLTYYIKKNVTRGVDITIGYGSVQFGLRGSKSNSLNFLKLEPNRTTKPLNRIVEKKSNC